MKMQVVHASSATQSEPVKSAERGRSTITLFVVTGS